MIDFYKYLEEYKNGTLSPELHKKMEDAAKNNAEYASSIKEYDYAAKISEGLLEIDVLKTIENLETDQHLKTIIKESPYLKTILILLGLLIITAITFWFITNQIEKSYDIAYEKLMAEYIAPINEDGTKSLINSDNDFVQGKNYFELNEFSKAEIRFERAILNSTESSELNEIYYWLGHTQFKLKKYISALKSFELSQREKSTEMITLINKILKIKTTN